MVNHHQDRQCAQKQASCNAYLAIYNDYKASEFHKNNNKKK